MMAEHIWTAEELAVEGKEVHTYRGAYRALADAERVAEAPGQAHLDYPVKIWTR